MNLAEAIAYYDRLGFCTIPIGPDKRPAFQSLEGGWLPYQQRRSVSDEWVTWWPEGRTEQQNIGVVCGQVSGGLLVIDCDDLATYHRLCQAMPDLRHSLTARSGKGMHIYCVALEPVATVSFWLHDKKHHVKAEGGYVVAPPSWHAEAGRPYAFVNEKAVPMVVNPATLRSALDAIGAVGAKPRQEMHPTDQPVHWVVDALASPSAEGGRDDQLIALAGYFHGRLPSDVAEEILVMVADKMNPPLGRDYVQAKVMSAARYDRRYCGECGRTLPMKS